MERGGGRKRKRAGLKGAAAIFRPPLPPPPLLLQFCTPGSAGAAGAAAGGGRACPGGGRGVRAPAPDAPLGRPVPRLAASPNTWGRAGTAGACALWARRLRGGEVRPRGEAGARLPPPDRARGGEGAAAMPGENIFLFVPNLIGYARIVFAIVSFYFMPCCPLTASSFYLLSGLLDAFDGHAARALNQGTRFGAMLDMLTDRCSTMCLLVNLALLYPRATLLFQLSMSLDVASHWLHLHSSVVRGSESHKMIDLSGNPVLRIYYTSRLALWVFSEWASGSPPPSRRSSPSSVSSTWSQPPATWQPWMRLTAPGRSDPGTSSPWPPTCPGSLAGLRGFPPPPARSQAHVSLMCCPACWEEGQPLW
uniref:CDP-diacylglycerol--inositol 3-phosphatidyltransferase n=2 Tax=Canis lupus familiaris TaxID=9615 RepID=A0A8I3MGU5_CANLF